MASSVTGTSKNVLRRKKSSLSEIRVTLLGDRDVGKSALVVRFITKRYIVDYDKGSDSKYKHELIVDADTVLFEILDSSSPITLNIKRFDFASHVTDLFLVLYSITDRQSYLYVRNFLKHLVMLKASGMPIPVIAIVGNKCDMAHLRQVSLEEGELLCTEYEEQLTLNHFGEFSVADQLASQLFSDIYRWVKRQKTGKSTIHTNRSISTVSSPSS
ncbi:hypothetical protein BLOT_006298 [Blomia tropicalis]|nr:hypothetical protein BLOT_006298 [Blomia tropicalis]